jgi:hypothetical protein
VADGYKQTEPFEIRGEWWRPDGAELVRRVQERPTPSKLGLDEGLAYMQAPRDLVEGSDPKHACRGPLRFDPDSGFHLSLLGSSEAAFPLEDSGYAVYGRTSQGAPVSLLDCRTSDSTTTLFGQGFADREIFGHSLVTGVHIQSLAAFEVDRVELRIPGLLEFLWGPAFSTDGKGKVGLGGRALASAESEEHSVQLDEGKLVFVVGTRQASGWHSVTLEREAIAQINLEAAIPFQDMRRKWIDPLVHLISFAIRRPTMPERVTALLERQADIVQYMRPLNWRSKLRADRSLVSYPALGESFDAFVSRWWEVHDEMQGVADFMFGAMSSGRTLEPQLTALASVIEGYHRTFHDAPAIDPHEHAENAAAMLETVERESHRKVYERRLSHGHELMQEDRLESFLERAGKVVPALGRKRGRLAKVVIATRNYFTHLAERSHRVLDGPAALHEANQLLSLAIECNLLLDLGLFPDAARQGVTRAYSELDFFRGLNSRGTAWPKLPPDPEL